MDTSANLGYPHQPGVPVTEEPSSESRDLDEQAVGAPESPDQASEREPEPGDNRDARSPRQRPAKRAKR